MDSLELRKMSIENAKLTLEQYKDMETEDEYHYYDDKSMDDVVSSISKQVNGGGNLSLSYDDFLKEIVQYLDKEKEVLNQMALTEDKKKGIQTLLDWVESDEMYRIGSREMEGYMIIDQLKKILLIEGYDKIDRELLNNLRGLYTKGNSNV